MPGLLQAELLQFLDKQLTLSQPGGRLCPPQYYEPPRFSDLATGLKRFLFRAALWPSICHGVFSKTTISPTLMEKLIFELLHTLILGHRLNLGHIIIMKHMFIPGHKLIFWHTHILGHTVILEQTICVCLIFLYNLNIKDARRAVPCNPEY